MKERSRQHFSAWLTPANSAPPGAICPYKLNPSIKSIVVARDANRRGPTSLPRYQDLSALTGSIFAARRAGITAATAAVAASTRQAPPIA